MMTRAERAEYKRAWVQRNRAHVRLQNKLCKRRNAHKYKHGMGGYLTRQRIATGGCLFL